MLEAGQIAQRLGGLSKRLHRRFNGEPGLDVIEKALGTISDEIDRLHGGVKGSFQRGGMQKLHDPRPEVPEQDDPSPPPPQVPDEQKRQHEADLPDEPEHEVKVPQDAPAKDSEEAKQLADLDASLQALGEEPLLPPPGEPLPDQLPPARMVALAEMSDKDLREFAKSNGVNTYRVKSENIIKGLEKKGFTTGPVSL